MLRNVKASLFKANIKSRVDACLNELRAVEEVRTEFLRSGA
jgi:hypothetical protein